MIYKSASRQSIAVKIVVNNNLVFANVFPYQCVSNEPRTTGNKNEFVFYES